MTPTSEPTTTDTATTPPKRKKVSSETQFMIVALLIIFLGGGAMIFLNKLTEPPPAPPPVPQKTVDVAFVDDLFNKARHQKGAADSALTIVEFADFQCPSCRRAFEKTVATMESKIPSFRLGFINLPLPMHERAVPAAVAAEAAAKQGKFWEMYAALFNGKHATLADSDFQEAAKSIGLDMTRFDADVKDSKPLRNLADQDVQIAKENGVDLTPTFYFHDKKGSTAVVSGAANLERFFPDLKDGIIGNDRIEPMEPEGSPITVTVDGKKEMK